MRGNPGPGTPEPSDTPRFCRERWKRRRRGALVIASISPRQLKGCRTLPGPRAPIPDTTGEVACFVCLVKSGAASGRVCPLLCPSTPPASPFSASPATRGTLRPGVLRDSHLNKRLAQEDQGLAGLGGRRKPSHDPKLPPWGSPNHRKFACPATGESRRSPLWTCVVGALSNMMPREAQGSCVVTAVPPWHRAHTLCAPSAKCFCSANRESCECGAVHEGCEDCGAMCLGSCRECERSVPRHRHSSAQQLQHKSSTNNDDFKTRLPSMIITSLIFYLFLFHSYLQTPMWCDGAAR